MPRRVTAVAALLVLLLMLTMSAVTTTAAAHATQPAIVAPASAPQPPTTDNPFIPADRDLSECISAVPQPGCGSKAQGGWRQVLVLSIVAVALAFIAWRIVHTVRRNRRTLEASGGR